tara:strand:+ start:7597 stop:7827 length:231 start_codon:yes stop_codon:yes gene_type:complete
MQMIPSKSRYFIFIKFVFQRLDGIAKDLSEVIVACLPTLFISVGYACHYGYFMFLFFEKEITAKRRNTKNQKTKIK